MTSFPRIENTPSPCPDVPASECTLFTFLLQGKCATTTAVHFFAVNSKESVLQPQIDVVQHNPTKTKDLDTWNNSITTVNLNSWEFQFSHGAASHAVKHMFVDDAYDLP